MASLSETYVCDGCQERVPTIVRVDNLEWRYRLNEIIGRAVDQGILPHLLAAYRMNDWIGDSYADFLGFLPGVNFISADGTNPTVEADLLAVKGGKLLVGECKRSGKELTPKDTERLVALGRSLECSRLIFATPSDFSQVEGVIAQSRVAAAPMPVTVWSGAELLDAAGWAWKFVDDEPVRMSPPEYLCAISERLPPSTEP